MARKPTADRGTPLYQRQREAWAARVAARAAQNDEDVTTKEHREQVESAAKVYEEHRVIKGRKVSK